VRKLASLKQFALLIDVNPFVTGYGKRGEGQNDPETSKPKRATDSQSVAL